MDAVGGLDFASAEAARERYAVYHGERLRAPRDFVAEAIEARARRRAEPPRPLSARR
jgi:hypothetical protein